MGNWFSNESSAEACVQGDKVYCQTSGNAHALATKTYTKEGGEKCSLRAQAKAPNALLHPSDKTSTAEASTSNEQGCIKGKVYKRGGGSASAEITYVDKDGENSTVVARS